MEDPDVDGGHQKENNFEPKPKALVRANRNGVKKKEARRHHDHCASHRPRQDARINLGYRNLAKNSPQ